MFWSRCERLRRRHVMNQRNVAMVRSANIASEAGLLGNSAGHHSAPDTVRSRLPAGPGASPSRRTVPLRATRHDEVRQEREGPVAMRRAPRDQTREYHTGHERRRYIALTAGAGPFDPASAPTRTDVGSCQLGPPGLSSDPTMTVLVRVRSGSSRSRGCRPRPPLCRSLPGDRRPTRRPACPGRRRGPRHHRTESAPCERDRRPSVPPNARRLANLVFGRLVRGRHRLGFPRDPKPRPHRRERKPSSAPEPAAGASKRSACRTHRISLSPPPHPHRSAPRRDHPRPERRRWGAITDVSYQAGSGVFCRRDGDRLIRRGGAGLWTATCSSLGVEPTPRRRARPSPTSFIGRRTCRDLE